ncbi:MAG TPA: methylamine utilization protein [Candidatus Aquabacterium excrementipullorum]|nr:methylamine utilization protein [Candidatus Aquabacterium excrementipullorum]
MTIRSNIPATHQLLIGALALMAAPVMAAPQAFTVTDAAGQPIPSAAVSVIVKGAKTTAAPGTVVDMIQKNRRFTPTVLPVQTGTAVNFPNLDTVRHHVYSFSPAKKFEIKLYAGTPAAPVVFDKPGTATLGCNIHDTMVGYIHVVDTPYFGTTDAAGKVTIDIPAGEHKAQLWYPALGEATPPIEIPIKTGGAVTLKGK